MKALVTGGAGFIGGHLSKRLVAAGHSVVVLDDLSTGSRTNVPPEATIVEGTVTDVATVTRAARDCDVVMHLAARRAVLRSVHHPTASMHVNVVGTAAVLEAARDLSIGRVVLASSSSVYGEHDHFPTPETQPVSPVSPYALSKATAEKLAAMATRDGATLALSLRLFNVYGPGQRPDDPYAQVVPLFIQALLADRPVTIHGDGSQKRDLTHVDDACTAFLRAAEVAMSAADAALPVNIASGEPVTIAELLACLERITGAQARTRFEAPRAGDVRVTHADTGRARAVLGHTASVTLADGLERTARSMAGPA